jgi:hypothetical protein
MKRVKYKHNLLKPSARFGNRRAGQCQIKVKIQNPKRFWHLGFGFAAFWRASPLAGFDI